MDIAVGTVKVRLLEKDAITRMMMGGKIWEPETRKIWPSLVRRDQIVLDVGAYTGVYAIAAAKLGAVAIAIEPHPANVNRLCVNAQLNDVEVQVLPVAASDRGGKGTLYCHKGPEVINDTASLDGGQVDIPATLVRIDDIYMRHPVALMKIDVEWHELQALKGAIGTIQTWRPQIIVETLGDAHRRAVTELLDGLGYYAAMGLDGRNELYVHRHR